MKKFQLTNLRELSVEEQKQLNGGQNPCDAQCMCKCYCPCNDKNPSNSTKDGMWDTAATSTSGSKQRQAMMRM